MRIKSWEDPYRVIKVMFRNSYMLETLQGDGLSRNINKIYLKNDFDVFGMKLRVLFK